MGGVRGIGGVTDHSLSPITYSYTFKSKSSDSLIKHEPGRPAELGDSWIRGVSINQLYYTIVYFAWNNIKLLTFVGTVVYFDQHFGAAPPFPGRNQSKTLQNTRILLDFIEKRKKLLLSFLLPNTINQRLSVDFLMLKIKNDSGPWIAQG